MSIRSDGRFAQLFYSVSAGLIIWQNWRQEAGYEIPKLALGLRDSKSISYSKMFINDYGGVDTCLHNFWHSSVQETQLHSALPKYGLDLVICFWRMEYGKGIRLTWQWRNLADTPLIERLRLRATVTWKSRSQGWLRKCTNGEHACSEGSWTWSTVLLLAYWNS